MDHTTHLPPAFPEARAPRRSSPNSPSPGGRGALLAAVALLVLCSGAQMRAQDWPHWRGPNYDGSTEAQGLPRTFSKEENVRWVRPLPGPSAATPVVVGDRIFLPSIDTENEKLLAVCLDRTSGEVLWSHVAGSGYQPAGAGTPISIHPRSNYASPSPHCDGEHVVFFYGNGDLVCYLVDGTELWRCNLQQDHGDFCFQWTFSASPTIFDGIVHLPILQRNEPVNGIGKAGQESFLLGLDVKTGAKKYRTVRPSPARRESLESYATPIPFSSAERTELLIVGGDVVTGHDPADGRELWRWGTWNEGHREMWWRLVPTVVVGAGTALVCAPKGAPVYAIELGGEGELDDSYRLWNSSGRANPVTTDVPTPLYYRDRFYVLSDLANALTCVDPATGEAEWKCDLPRDYRWRASPTGADGRIYFMNHHGEVFVVDAQSGEIQHRAQFGGEDDDQIRSSVVVAHGALFLRTNDALYCVASPSTADTASGGSDESAGTN